MGGYIRSKAAMIAAVWLFLAATSTTTLFGPSATIVSAKRTTSRNLKTFVNQQSNKQQSVSYGALPVTIAHSALSNKKPQRGLMGKGGKGHEGYDDDYGKGKGKGKGGHEGYDDDYGKGKGKGKGGNEGNDDDYGKGKGKGKKGKGKGKEKEKGKGKGKGSGNGLPKICSKLDFGEVSSDDHYEGKGKGGKGKGKGYDESENDGALCDPNVFDEAKKIVDISIFVSLIEQAKLEEIFLCAGPFTVLAPSNAAFADNPSITEYLADVHNVKELREVLLYHILPGLTLVDDFTKGSVEALQGDVIEVNVDPLLFNSVASVKEGDITACNGVINIIDSILLPPGMNSMAHSCSQTDSLCT